MATRWRPPAGWIIITSSNVISVHPGAHLLSEPEQGEEAAGSADSASSPVQVGGLQPGEHEPSHAWPAKPEGSPGDSYRTGCIGLASLLIRWQATDLGGCLNMAQKPAWGTRPLSTRVQRWRVPGVRTPATLLHWSPERRPWHKSWAAAPTSRRAGSARGTDPSAVNVMAGALCTREPTSSASNATERVLAHMSEDNGFR